MNISFTFDLTFLTYFVFESDAYYHYSSPMMIEEQTFGLLCQISSNSSEDCTRAQILLILSLPNTRFTILQHSSNKALSTSIALWQTLSIVSSVRAIEVCLEGNRSSKAISPFSKSNNYSPLVFLRNRFLFRQFTSYPLFPSHYFSSRKLQYSSLSLKIYHFYVSRITNSEQVSRKQTT